MQPIAADLSLLLECYALILGDELDAYRAGPTPCCAAELDA